jgi:TetR/AcrR family acrAB operon transcriptional repressor
MRRTREEAERTRQSILKASLKVFSTRGYARTRLEEVASEAGVTRGAIYWHFSNKADLYASAVIESVSGYRERLTNILQSDLSPLTKIRTLMKEWLVTLERDEAYRTLVEMALTKTEFDDQVMSGVRDWFSFVDRVQETIADLLRRGIEAGEIDSQVDPELVALALISYLNGIEETWFIQTMSNGESRFSPARMAEEFIEFILRGMRNG